MWTFWHIAGVAFAVCVFSAGPTPRLRGGPPLPFAAITIVFALVLTAVVAAWPKDTAPPRAGAGWVIPAAVAAATAALLAAGLWRWLNARVVEPARFTARRHARDHPPGDSRVLARARPLRHISGAVGRSAGVRAGALGSLRDPVDTRRRVAVRHGDWRAVRARVLRARGTRRGATTARPLRRRLASSAGCNCLQSRCVELHVNRPHAKLLAPPAAVRASGGRRTVVRRRMRPRPPGRRTHDDGVDRAGVRDGPVAARGLEWRTRSASSSPRLRRCWCRS